MQTIPEKTLKTLLLTAIPNGVQTLAVTTATRLTIPSNTTYALIDVEAATSSDYVRFWCDGTLPTATDGVKRGDGTAFDLLGPAAIAKFRVIGISSGATLQIQYFK
jgi:hypothetical protein